jgi:hypothetical protein
MFAVVVWDMTLYGFAGTFRVKVTTYAQNHKVS